MPDPVTQSSETDWGPDRGREVLPPYRQNSATNFGEHIMSETARYTVRPVTRWVITRAFGRDLGNGRTQAGCEPMGEFDTEEQANRVCAVLAADEDRRRGADVTKEGPDAL